MSHLGSRTPTPSSTPPPDSGSPKHAQHRRSKTDPFPSHNLDLRLPATPPDYGSPVNGSPTESPGRQRSNSRPLSMVQTYNPPLMDVNAETPPELQPVFSLLNSHSNKLYQEGYFLKLDDQNTLGKPNPDRTWTECFAQLVGTVLSLWDAAELDAAGEDGEVLPKFINLTDASIKMIESLPTRSSDEQPLQNILSISTAGRNRYLLHFNSHHALVQWTAGIRLAIYEHSTLQEAYTGALVAGKGKTVNNINVIMERSRVPIEHWVRVRFGAGVPWRRCWCVINPPDEKEYAKLQKELKKRSAYDRSAVPVLKGDIRFYDSRIDRKKQKKAQPIASITDAYSAYAIYPQAKALIDASTLLKIEGNVTIHSEPPSSSEGFIFIMPEVPPAVNGFEMLLRFLFPTWDTFGLYGRPGRLIASVLDARSLMFAMPKSKRYGYLDILDVTSLIVRDGSTSWSEREWRKQLKEVTGTRMNAVDEMPKNRTRSSSRQSSRSNSGNGTGKPKVGFADEPGSTRSSRSFSLSGPPRTDSAPPDGQRTQFKPAMAGAHSNHTRNSSDPNVAGGPFRNDFGSQPGPYQSSPQRNQLSPANYNNQPQQNMAANEPPVNDFENMRMMATPEPVSRPPAFNHGSQARPVSKVYHSPELRQANSRLSAGTLSQLANAGGLNMPKDDRMGGAYPKRGMEDGAVTGPSVLPHANSMGISANDDRSREVLNPSSHNRPPAEYPAPLNLQQDRPPVRPGTSEGRRPTYPPPGGDPRGDRSQAPMALTPGGQPFNARPRTPNAPRPGNGPPRQGSHDNYNGGNYRPGDRRGPPPQHPYGPGPGPGPGPRNPQFEGYGDADRHMSTATSSTGITTNEIIDHYARDQYGGPSPMHERPSVDRPRAGVLKTVGGAEVASPVKTDFDVNFGPTVNYGATSPPRKAVPPPGGPGQGPRPYSPAGQRPPNHQGRGAPGPRPPFGRGYSSDNAKRTQPWQPGGSAPGTGAPGVSAEQYVQQRAAAAQPHMAHARTPSGNVLTSNPETQSPSIKRRSSYDMMHTKHTRSGSSDLLQRPSSQSGNATLDWAGPGNASSQLSAREQEHMSRMTGAPLVNVPPARGMSPGPGLVGAIDAREREKQQMRQGANNQAAQYGMGPRPGPNDQMHMQQYQQPPPQWAMGERSMSPGPAYHSPSPGPSFSRPIPPGGQSSLSGDPRMPPPQGQYAHNPGSGRGYNPQYQGQAF